MKRSQFLYLILAILSLAVVIAGFVLPPANLDSLELVFLWIVMPIMGVLWIRAYVDDVNGK